MDGCWRLFHCLRGAARYVLSLVLVYDFFFFFFFFFLVLSWNLKAVVLFYHHEATSLYSHVAAVMSVLIFFNSSDNVRRNGRTCSPFRSYVGFVRCLFSPRS
jgi:hypothetical protein